MKKIYCISGLGSDERIFSRLSIPGRSLVHLKWITPLKEEPIGEYAERMARQITTEDPVILGVSFGGMMAIEIARIIPRARVFLVSSVKSRKELPEWMKLSGSLKLNKLIPSKRGIWVHLGGNNFLGAESEEEIRLCDEYRRTVDPAYLRWAVGQVINWKNDWQPSQVYHLHGSKDKIFPLKKVSASHVIPGGGHFMIMNRAKEVSEIISQLC